MRIRNLIGKVNKTMFTLELGVCHHTFACDVEQRIDKRHRITPQLGIVHKTPRYSRGFMAAQFLYLGMHVQRRLIARADIRPKGIVRNVDLSQKIVYRTIGILLWQGFKSFSTLHKPLQQSANRTWRKHLIQLARDAGNLLGKPLPERLILGTGVDPSCPFDTFPLAVFKILRADRIISCITHDSSDHVLPTPGTGSIRRQQVEPCRQRLNLRRTRRTHLAYRSIVYYRRKILSTVITRRNHLLTRRKPELKCILLHQPSANSVHCSDQSGQDILRLGDLAALHEFSADA